jgi:hypothetical protein
LSILVRRAQDNGLLQGLASDLLSNGINVLSYDDDTIFLLEDDLEGVRNLKFIMCIFEHFTRLKINFHKRKINSFANAIEKKEEC